VDKNGGGKKKKREGILWWMPLIGVVISERRKTSHENKEKQTSIPLLQNSNKENPWGYPRPP